jgi:hypothetical protein
MTTTDNVKQLLSKKQLLPLHQTYNEYLNEFVNESWYKNILKASKDCPGVFGLLNECSKIVNPKMIIVGDIFYSMSMRCAALISFVNEICDNFGFDTDVSSADVKRLLRERVVILDTSTYKLQGENINDDWKTMIKQIIIKLVSNRDDIVVLSLGSGNNMIMRDIIENGLIAQNNVIMIGHPSPKATNSNFKNSNCFRECNKKLISLGILPVRYGIVFT